MPPAKFPILRLKLPPWKWAVVITALALLVGGGVIMRFRPAGPAPPAISPQGLEPAVWTALEDSRQEVSCSPNSSNAWGHLGKVLLAHKFAEEAGICFARAESLDPTEPRWPYFLGMILDLKDTSAAIAKFQRAVDLCNNQPDGPRLKLAEALLQQGQSPEA